MAERFAADSVIRRVDAEGAILLGGGRALLMQLAHPKVAAGVAEHSDFEHDPLKRLFGTLEATYTIVFGTDAEVERMARRVRAMHGRVHGDGYDANDPDLLAWVNATLIDTAVVAYEHLAGPLSTTEKDEYVRDSRTIAEVLGCPLEDQPSTWSAFRDYTDSTVADLEVSATARTVADSILRPSMLPRITAPALALNRFITIGTLPPSLRSQYDLAWTDRRSGLLRQMPRVVRPAHRLIPRPIRHAPKAVFLRRVRRRSAASAVSGGG